MNKNHTDSGQASLQNALLAGALRALRPGGWLIGSDSLPVNYGLLFRARKPA